MVREAAQAQERQEGRFACTDLLPNAPLPAAVVDDGLPLIELEDIVGELLDQASDVDAQSQDTTGNNIIADMEMGWGVADGPMPCFSAKGKSGNTRPNDNEMTGRSGAGREGQSNGELVENHVKGLEGRETHARRTQYPFQKGQVTEDEDSTMNARATGGGKLGGESESIGMFGQAPHRDLNSTDHGAAPMKLRQETEALYAKARLLYLGTGRLGNVTRELRGVESAGDKIRSMGSLHRRVLRRLEDTQVELNSGVVLPMPIATVSKTGGAVTDDVDISKISEEYRDIIRHLVRGEFACLVPPPRTAFRLALTTLNVAEDLQPVEVPTPCAIKRVVEMQACVQKPGCYTTQI